MTALRWARTSAAITTRAALRSSWTCRARIERRVGAADLDPVRQDRADGAAIDRDVLPARRAHRALVDRDPPALDPAHGAQAHRHLVRRARGAVLDLDRAAGRGRLDHLRRTWAPRRLLPPASGRLSTPARALARHRRRFVLGHRSASATYLGSQRILRGRRGPGAAWRRTWRSRHAPGPGPGVGAGSASLGIVAVMLGVIVASSSGAPLPSGERDRDQLACRGARRASRRPSPSGRRPPPPADLAADRAARAPRRRRRSRRRGRCPGRSPACPSARQAALQHPIAVMVDDDSGRPAAVRVQLGVDRLARARRGRRPALHDDLPGRGARRRRADSERAPVLHRVGIGVAGHVRPPRRLAAGDRDAPRQRARGQWVYNADGFRWLGQLPVADRRPVRAAQRLHGRRAPAEAGGARRTPTTARSSRSGRSSRMRTAAFARSAARITVTYPYETITYRYDAATNRYVRYINASTTPQIDRNDGQIVAPANVVDPAHGLRSAQRRPSEQAPPGGARRRQGPGLDLDRTGSRSRAPGRRQSRTAPTLLFGPDGKAVTLTAGQTFVQVLPLNYAFTFVPGHRLRLAAAEAGSAGSSRSSRRPRRLPSAQRARRRRRRRSSSQRRRRTTTQRLDDDPARHLRAPDAPVLEGDRHLAHACAGAARPMGHLDLEDVAAGMHAVERDRARASRRARP